MGIRVHGALSVASPGPAPFTDNRILTESGETPKPAFSALQRLTLPDLEPKVSRSFETSNKKLMSGSSAEPVTQTELEVADTIGRLMEFWGFKRPMGRMWTLLYLSPAPLGAAELGEQLKMSAGAVSMTLNELLKWGAVKKSWRPGERRDFYEAETSIGKLVQRVLRDRELELVRQFAEALSNAEAALPRHSGAASAPDFKRDRVHELQRLSKLGETLLTALVAGKVVDPTPFLKVYGE
jgi:DNA-binding transcriptional regulator GbsR (MarR family)